MEKLYDIREVCERLGITSRTLRYYEANHLVTSTTYPPSRRRHYTPAQTCEIQRVLALRSLGLPVKTIRSLLQDGTTLEEAITTRRAELLRCIGEKQRQINLLEEVLHDIRTGALEPQPATDAVPTSLYTSDTQLTTAARCTDALLQGSFETCETHFSTDMQTLLPKEALRRFWEITTEPAGALRSIEPPIRLDPPNMVLQYLHYENQTVRIRYVFHGEEICGLWTDYAPEVLK